ncbi:Glu S.griseus protease inhibitor [Sesamum angolense]|uniref:Glu S.griseus protease inhibitor n=1 Tax=Sesamum angolense TaxID=2727404 RepID=A0AAE1W9W7_9LAMI|nr:Glu S.griseus protease inhibitor [Sesamum angolense]
MPLTCQGKDSWPELIGVSGEIAVKTIEEENSFVTAIIVPPSQTAIPADFRCDRVFVFVDDEGVVERVPMIF